MIKATVLQGSIEKKMALASLGEKSYTDAEGRTVVELTREHMTEAHEQLNEDCGHGHPAHYKPCDLVVWTDIVPS